MVDQLDRDELYELFERALKRLDFNHDGVLDQSEVSKGVQNHSLIGTYKVVFPAGPDDPLLVSMPTEAELLLGAGATRYGVWPAVSSSRPQTIRKSRREVRVAGRTLSICSF